ncbi:Hypothetical predicted protein [Mytilus galloprovincialis]|uniref:Uncharacterized protein n=1 Tax=Mytilus galloprovincialis TaxID=29158 RepID=A0A8B6F8R7_MYTGA|nr:Hypothetical predicted protein [Mytilus galloprovincialis]
MENETVTKVITLDKYCYGLSSSDDSLVVGLIDDEIRIIDLEGNTLKSIQVKSESNLDYLVYCNDRVIYSDYVGNAVYCVDGDQVNRSGNIHRIYQDHKDFVQILMVTLL